jgi:hypothetical protein
MTEATVKINATGFSPNPLNIPANTQVVWVNATGTVQDATSNDGGQTFTTGPIQPGQNSLPITFSNGGVQIPYSSTASGLQGLVSVQAMQKSAAAGGGVSFATDILPLFRAIDIAHMQPAGVLLNQYSYMSNPANNHQNATTVQAYLTGAKQPRMPPGGPFWTQQQLDLYAQWMSDGYLP